MPWPNSVVMTMTDMTREQIEAVCEALPCAYEALTRAGYYQCAQDMLDALTAIRQLQRDYDAAEKARKAAARDAMDRTYMQAAYYAMLGPNGRQMADVWRNKGVLRVHHSWGPEAAAMTGEERAAHMLAWDKAAETAEPIHDVDAPLPLPPVGAGC